jgi:hypothetical protein
MRCHNFMSREVYHLDAGRFVMYRRAP